MVLHSLDMQRDVSRQKPGNPSLLAESNLGSIEPLLIMTTSNKNAPEMKYLIANRILR